MKAFQIYIVNYIAGKRQNKISDCLYNNNLFTFFF